MIKIIRPGASSQSDALLAWINDGCAEAIRLKYLKTVTLSVTEMRNNLQTAIESYSLNIEYPDSEKHNQITSEIPKAITLECKSDTQKSQVLSLGSPCNSASKESSFEKQASRMVRCLCVMLQTLKPLPQKKYLSMQINYYDELTPKNYEPTGFQSTIFDISNLFDSKSVFKHQFSTVKSTAHIAQLLLQTTVDKEDIEIKNNITTCIQNLPAGLVSSEDDAVCNKSMDDKTIIRINNESVTCEEIAPTEKNQSLDEKHDISMQIKDSVNKNNVKGSKTSSDIKKTNDINEVEKIQKPSSENDKAARVPQMPAAVVPKTANQDIIVPYLKPFNEGKNSNEEGIKIACLCRGKNQEVDMILCETCFSWMHTPCAGFFNNRDKRIPNKYTCLRCTIRPKAKLMIQLQNLARIRRAISIIYSEGIQSIALFSERLGLSWQPVIKVIRRLENEQLIMRPTSQSKLDDPNASSHVYTVLKTAIAKEKIRYFFGLDLNAFPEIAVFVGKNTNIAKCNDSIKLGEEAIFMRDDFKNELESPKKRCKPNQEINDSKNMIPFNCTVGESKVHRLSTVSVPRSCH